MNLLTIVLVSAFIALAAADWMAIWRGDDDLRRTTKPAATAVLVLIAASAGEMAGDARAALIVAVVLCLVGDVALLGAGGRGDEFDQSRSGRPSTHSSIWAASASDSEADTAQNALWVEGRRPSDRHFLAGLAAFALGHIAYVVTAVLVGVSWPRLALAFPILVVLLGFQASTGMLVGARRHGGQSMLIAVAVYSLIISAMVVTATGTPSWLAFAGSTWFAVSDSMIAYNRFVRPFHRADLPIMITYHGGQLLLIAGLIIGG